MKQYSVVVASSIDRDNLVVEIWDDNEMIAEINHEGKVAEIEIYVNKNKLTVNYQSFLDSLIEGKRKLDKS